MGGAGKPEHFYDILNNKKVSGIINGKFIQFFRKWIRRSKKLFYRKKNKFNKI